MVGPHGVPAHSLLVRLANAAGSAAAAMLVAACAPPATEIAPPRAASSTTPSTARTEPGSPAVIRSVEQLRMHATGRIFAANPQATYSGSPPQALLAIPVLEIELNADGSVRRIEVLRQPRHARDTTQLAIDAVRRAAPFGDVSQMPRPWKFSETFLFDDERRFKPRSLEP
jgi:hypothetical protein